MNIGIDLGGSHIGIGIVNDNGKIIAKKEQDLQYYLNNSNNINLTNKNIKDYITENIILLINSLLREVGSPMCLIKKIGIGTPGKVKDNIIKDMHNLGINEFDLSKRLSKYYGVEVNVRNDAKCAALAEKKYGSLKNYNNESVFLCIGTGIGGAYFYNGKIVEPSKNAGFEFGHMIIQKGDILCNCGNKGCFEKYASIKTFKQKIKEILNLDENIISKDLLNELYKNLENENVIKYIDEYIDYLLLGISNIVNILKPEVICLGGGFVYFEKILFTRLLERQQLNEYKFDKTKIVLAKLGNDAGIIGASLN